MLSTLLLLALTTDPQLTPPPVGVEVTSSRPEETPDAPHWFEDRNRTRYFLAWSGMQLERGEANVSQLELGLTVASIGITDFLSVDLGTAIPAYIFGLNGLNGLAGLRGGGTLLPWLHVSIAFHGVYVPALKDPRTSTGVGVLALASGAITIGTRDQNLTLMIGAPISFTSGPLDVLPMVSLSGLKRLGRHVALMIENHFIYTSKNALVSFLLVDMAGVRLMNERIALDLGLVLASTPAGPMGPPLPVLNFTYNF